MSFIYTFDTINNNSSATLQSKINQDLELGSLGLTVGTSSTNIITVTSSSQLSSLQLNSLNNLVYITCLGATTDQIQPLPINLIQRQVFNSNVVPDSSQDNTFNYNVGSIVTVNSTGNVYFCTNNSTSNAIWPQINSTPNISSTTITTNYTPTILQSITTNSNTLYLLQSSILAKGISGTTPNGGFIINGLFYNNSGTLSQIGTTDSLLIYPSINFSSSVALTSSWNANFSISGQSVNVQIVGATSNNILWLANTKINNI